MDTVTLILAAIVPLALALMIAPNVFAMNRGRVLQNIAAWLAIFSVLGLVYKYVGPGADPLQHKPAPIGHALEQNTEKAPLLVPADQSSDLVTQDKNLQDPGYIPPRD